MTTKTALKIVHRETAKGYKEANERVRALQATGQYTKVTQRRCSNMYGFGISILAYAPAEATIQLRGTCQVCGGHFSNEKGTLARHGYKRPRWGYLIGRCNGQNELPAELDLTITNATLAYLVAAIEHAETVAIPALEAEEAATPYADRYRRILNESTKRHETDPTCISYRLDDARSLYYHQKGHRDMLNQHVVPRFGQPLIEATK